MVEAHALDQTIVYFVPLILTLVVPQIPSYLSLIEETIGLTL